MYARGRNGKFLIRVEDTDRERSTEEAVKAIFDGLSWLELFADEEPVFQYSRADRHREVVNELLERGGAYRDFTSAEETGRLRDLAKAERRTFEFVAAMGREAPAASGQTVGGPKVVGV